MMSSQRSQRARVLADNLGHLGFVLWLEGAEVRVRPAAELTPELRAELAELKAELTEYLAVQGETVVDYTAADPEGRAHSDMRTLPRTPEEAEKQRADAERARDSARRRYQGGQVLINDRNNFGHYMRELRRLREQAEARERGEIPPEGRYRSRFDVFK